MNLLLFAGAMIVALVVIWWFGWDQDDGGYPDSFTTFTTWPYDKAYHTAGGFLLCLLAIWAFSLHPWVAWIGTLIAGIGFEFVQRFRRITPKQTRRSRHGLGFFSWRDVVCDGLGALLAVGISHLVTRA